MWTIAYTYASVAGSPVLSGKMGNNPFFSLQFFQSYFPESKIAFPPSELLETLTDYKL